MERIKKNLCSVVPAKAGTRKKRNLDSRMRGNDRIVDILRSGGVGILPTDTIYGIVGSALMPKTVTRIYRLRKRNLKKPMIVLIASIEDIKQFGIVIDVATKKVLARVWPGKVSIIFPISPRRKSELKRFRYLHRGTGALAFRIPRSAWLRKLLEETGPLVAPSVNFEGELPALTIRAAKKYFGKNVDFYINAGRLVSKPSTLIKIEKGKVTVLREGAAKLDSGL
jgi:L-threonylcarbamoyladenylate synthase